MSQVNSLSDTLPNCIQTSGSKGRFCWFCFPGEKVEEIRGGETGILLGENVALI